MQRLTRVPQGWLILGCLSLLLVTCQRLTSEQPPTPSTTPPPDSVGSARVKGVVIAESDVRGQPDEPLSNQLILAIPHTGFQTITDDDTPPRFLSVRLETRPEGMVTTRTDAQGRYRLSLPPGEFALCLAYPEDTSGSAPPLLIRGCGMLTVTAGSERTVNISSGLGEILLIEPEDSSES